MTVYLLAVRCPGRSSAWQSARFGTERPPVRVRPPRLITCGSGVVVTQQPSKLFSRVRIPSAALASLRACSSTAERSAHNRLVQGSNPCGPTSTCPSITFNNCSNAQPLFWLKRSFCRLNRSPAMRNPRIFGREAFVEDWQRPVGEGVV